MAIERERTFAPRLRVREMTEAFARKGNISNRKKRERLLAAVIRIHEETQSKLEEAKARFEKCAEEREGYIKQLNTQGKNVKELVRRVEELNKKMKGTVDIIRNLTTEKRVVRRMMEHHRRLLDADEEEGEKILEDLKEAHKITEDDRDAVEDIIRPYEERIAHAEDIS